MGLTREAVLRVVGEPVGYQGRVTSNLYTDRRGLADPKPVYTEDQLLAMYEAGVAAERAVSDKLLAALRKSIDRHDNPRLGVPDRTAHIVGPLRAAIAEVEAMRKENKE